jgi:phosphopantetheine attachment domain protein
MKEITKEKILEIVNSVQDMEATVDQCDDDLLELGLDSIKFIQIIVSLEEAFECEIPDEKLLLTEMNSVNKMLEVLQLAVSESNKSVLESSDS